MKTRLFDKIFGTPLDRALRNAVKKNQHRILMYWNRGLGDIALGIYGVVERVRSFIPNAEITVVTRQELEEAFHLLSVDHVIVDPLLYRKTPDSLDIIFKRVNINKSHFDIVLDAVNPTRWLRGQLGKLVPKLQWNAKYDELWKRFPELSVDQHYVALHVNSETGQHYGYVKDWPKSSWQHLVKKNTKNDSYRFILFGHTPDNDFVSDDVIDLRGKTSFLEMLSVIKNRCATLIAPDSGILSTIYYLNCNFPLKIISLWADPRQGVLKQNVASPNPSLVHHALLGEGEDVAKISVESVDALI